MKFKIDGGTARSSGTSLCVSCRHSMVTKGQTLDEEVVHCRAASIHATRVTFKVTSCSSYIDHQHPTYMEMIQAAWILQPGSKRRPAGFIRGSELRQEELAEVIAQMRDPEGE